KPRFKPHQAPLTFKRSDQIELNDRFNPDSEAFQIVARVFSRFRDESIRSGSLPLALILPDIDDIKVYRRDNTKSDEPLLSYFEAHSIQYIDLMEAFEKYGKDKPVGTFFSGHYNASGNDAVAHYINDYLVGH